MRIPALDSTQGVEVVLISLPNDLERHYRFPNSAQREASTFFLKKIFFFFLKYFFSFSFYVSEL